MPLFLVAVLVVAVAATVPDEKVTVSFLDVGQGDAVLVRQGTTQVLIDGGPGPQEIVNKLGERMPFWDRTIEVVILTHPHADHLAGLVEVLRRYNVKQVFVAPGSYDSTLYREWLRLIDEKSIRVAVVTAGYR
jgi:competence protein ComEC